jgi:HAMP domain-containing protein
MLVICEDCAKKYHIDEKRIKAAKAKFSCRACGHIIVVEKPKEVEKSLFDSKTVFTGNEEEKNDKADPSNQETDRSKASNTKKTTSVDIETVRSAVGQSVVAQGKGFPSSIYLLVIMLVGFLIISGTFTYIYLNAIPDVINHQIELRSQSLAASLKGALRTPLLQKNYLKVNQEVKRTSKLPGVAYAAVRNKKGIVIAGFFGSLNEFDNHFSRKIKEKGFQPDILTKNAVISGKKEGGAKIRVGGVLVYDQVTSVPDTGGEIHIGIHIEEIERDIRDVLLSPRTCILAALALLTAYIFFVLLDRLITGPMRALTNVANRISLGELDLAIMSGGPREMRELGAALERMRHSIKVAMERITK